MNNSKPRVIKDYIKLDPDIQEKIKLEYPYGFSENLVKFTNKDGKLVSALPFEADDRYYLVRMTVEEALQIVEEDEDFDDDGSLKEDIKEEYKDKYAELELEEEEEVDPYADKPIEPDDDDEEE